MTTLREFIIECAAGASRVFERDGQLEPAFWDAITREGNRMLLPAIPAMSQDEMAALMRALFETADVVRYVWVCEAWMLDTKDSAAASRWQHEGLAEAPGRIEVLMFSAEDAQEGMLTAHREIKRDRNGRPRLEPLIFNEGIKESQGRMVGMLPEKGTRQ